MLAHHVAEEIDLALAQRAFAGLGVQPLLTKAGQRLTDMLFVLPHRVTIHDDVVQKHEHELVEEFCERIVH